MLTKFDSSKTGALNKSDLRACLFSYGEEVTNQQLDASMVQYGKGGVVPLPQFRQLIMNTRGLVESKRVILEAFRYLARDQPVCALSHLLRVLPADTYEVCP